MRESGRLADSRHPGHHKRDKGGHRRWLLSTSSWELEDATAGCEEPAENERDVSERVTVTRYVSPITLAICQQPENSRSPREGVQLVSNVSSAPPSPGPDHTMVDPFPPEMGNVTYSPGPDHTMVDPFPPYYNVQTKMPPSKMATRMTKFFSPSQRAVKPSKARQGWSKYFFIFSALFCVVAGSIFTVLCIVMIVTHFSP